MDNKSFCQSDAFQFFVVWNNKFSASGLFRIVSDDKIINHKALGDIWHTVGYEFRELSHVAKQNSYSYIYLQEQGFIPLASVKRINRNKIDAIFCLIQAVSNMYP